MIARVAFVCAAVLILVPFSLRADMTDWSLANKHITVRGAGERLTHLAFDPAGRADFSQNLLREAGFAGVALTPETRLEQTADAVRLIGCDSVMPIGVSNEKADTAVMLHEGEILGQSFTVAAGSFTAIAIKLPTWHTSDSGAIITLRRGDADGETIATRRAVDVADNSWQTLTFDGQGPGEYTIGLSELEGQLGWWAMAEDVLPGGIAFVNGSPRPDLDFTLRLTGTRPIGEADLTFALDGPRLALRLTCTLTGDERPSSWPLSLSTYWENDGYDVSEAAVPFSRFFSSSQRYFCVEQLKRSDIGGHLTFFGSEWIEAEGTGSYDLRFSGGPLWLTWDTAPDALALNLKSPYAEDESGTLRTEYVLDVRPREDSIPESWPAFETPDAELTADLNRFLYERNHSYPPAAGPAPWLEWMALARFWFAGPMRDDQRGQVAGTPMTDEGYVHTWGGQAGWPFPNPKRYDTRHFDTNARLILAVWRYACWTGDVEFLESQAERVRKAMHYQLTTLGGENGLIIAVSEDVNGKHKGVGNNYWDILPFGHLDAYANAYFYASLEAMAQIEEMLGGRVATGFQPVDPDEYRRLSERTRTAFNDTFWDDDKGRYIGCIDVDGEAHDYGFTFVNTEAMAYGLASEAQAGRIYRWMETEPTSSGEADTYSRWIFAPRANTIHNPPWTPDDGSLEPEAAEPWWHFGWRGTDYDDQCQDGGAILYTSFYDLMARSRLLGADNAWQRWTEILGRYRMPDRLCGGSPLYRGEHPQRVHAGAVGLDIPFPESGLVPCWFLYGVAGVNATARGLEVKPNLPADLPWLTVRNVSYHGLTLDVHVRPRSVKLISRTPGRRFTWKRRITPGEAALFTAPPSS